jgi:hypothetical protein
MGFVEARGLGIVIEEMDFRLQAHEPEMLKEEKLLPNSSLSLSYVFEGGKANV